MIKKVLIRVDGNSKIGLGHIYRGIALAEMLKEEFEISFLVKHSSNTTPLLGAGFMFAFIPKGIYNEPQYLNSVTSKDTIIVLDGYDFNQAYQQELKNYHFKLVYIDDLVEGLQKADVVINHNPGVKEKDYQTENHTTLALGLNYALLRPLFINVDSLKLRKRNVIESVFVSFGGADSKDFTFQVVEQLIEIPNVTNIYVVLGSAYPHTRINNLISKKVKIHRDLSESDIFGVMNNSSIGIVPASSVLFELFSLNIPAITGYFVDNQKPFYDYLVEQNMVNGVGDLNNFDFGKLDSKIKELSLTPMTDIIDGNQSVRIRNLFNKI